MFQVRIHGRGGQGVVTAAEMLSVAAFKEGRHAQAFPSFGSERTGAPVVSFCRMADKEIRLREPILVPDALIVQDPTLFHSVDVFQGLPDSGYVLINSARGFEDLHIADFMARFPEGRARCVPASDMARLHVGRPLPNAALLGGFAAITGQIKLDSVLAAIRETFPGRIGEAIALCRPEVVCAYPITPQTHIVEGLAELVCDRESHRLRVHQRRVRVCRPVGRHRLLRHGRALHPHHGAVPARLGFGQPRHHPAGPARHGERPVPAVRGRAWRGHRVAHHPPPCNQQCPAGENIQGGLYHAESGYYRAVWDVLVQDNPLKAARAIDAFLRGVTVAPAAKRPVAEYERLNPWYYTDAPQTVQPTLNLLRRQTSFEEVKGGLDESTALFEARRCLSCGNCFECDNCFGVCPDNAVIKLGPGQWFQFNYDFCKGCGVCAAECPCGAIDMVAEEV